MGAFVPRVLLVGGVAGLMGLAYPAYAQEPPPPIIEEMLREALATKPIELICEHLIQIALAGGGADVMLNWMPSALAARERGLPVVNIAQPFVRSGLQLTCWADTGIESPEDLRGRTIGVWFFGNEYPFLSWMSQLGIPTQGGEDGVEILQQGFNVDPLLQRQADCISTMTYNEYWQVIDAGVSPDELITFKYEDMGVATLEDGLYVLEENLEDPAFLD